MQKSRQFDNHDDYDDFDDNFEFDDVDIPSDEEIDALQGDMLKKGAIKKEDVKIGDPTERKVNPESFDLDKHLSKLPDPSGAEASLDDWIMGDTSGHYDPDDYEDSDYDGGEEKRFPNNEQYKWPKEYIGQVMKRGTGHAARMELQNHLEKNGLVDRSNPDNPTVTLRRVGMPRTGVTNASYIPDWGSKDDLTSTGYGKGTTASDGLGLYEWQAPLEHVLGSGMTAEGEVFAVHHPSIKVNRIK
jgi:hypothetical protein